MTGHDNPQSAEPPPPDCASHPTEQDYLAVFECNPTPMWVFDLETHRFLAVNTAAALEYGYPPETFLALAVQDLYEASEHDRLNQGLQSSAQELHSGEWMHRRQDGSVLTVNIHASNLTFRDRPARLIHVTNVSAQLKAEAASRESEQLLSAVVASSDDAILSKSADGTILTWNAAAQRMYGYTSEEAIGSSIEMIIPAERHEAVAALRHAVTAGMRIVQFETAALRKDGAQLAVSVTLSPIVNRAGVVVGISSTAHDITDRKSNEDQARQAQKMDALGSLAAGIAHDFNNLLTVIAGNAELAIDQTELGSTLRADIEEIRMAGYSATLLTRQLLTFSRKSIAEDAIVNLNDIVTRLDRILRRTLGEDVEFMVTQGTGLGSVQADPGQLEQVLMNLVINARDAMPEGGLLTVATDNAPVGDAIVAARLGAAAGSFVTLSVTDTGCGMTPDVVAQIFNPFFTTKGPIEGTGLGLSTVFGIVQQAGGFMAVDSEPGRGSTFAVYLPHLTDDPLPREITPITPVGTGHETILLVEDDSNIRALSARGLRRHGYTVLPARHAIDAERLAERHDGPIHLLLTDIVLPGANGRALAERLVASIPGLRVLYTSGYTDSVATLQAIRASAAEFIQKPYSPDTLGRKVRSVLDAPVPSAG